MATTATATRPSAQIFHALVTSAVQRAHRAAMVFESETPAVQTVEVLVGGCPEQLDQADLEYPPDLVIVIDDGLTVRFGIGATETTMERTLVREWSAAVAPDQGGAR